MFGKSFKKTVIAGAAASLMAIGLAGTASAGTITVGGVTWDPDDVFDFTAGSAGSLKENTVFGVGDELNGMGRVDSINLDPAATFCASGCELTFSFGGYILTDQDIAAGIQIDNLIFTGGWINFYVDATPDYDGLTLATAVDGTLWLTLVGHSNTQGSTGFEGTLFGKITFGTLGSGGEFGTGGGLLDVDAGGGVACVLGLPIGCNPEFGNTGLANAHFDTNTKPDNNSPITNADFIFTSDFSPELEAAVNAGGFPLSGSATLKGNSIPEPASLAIFGFSLLGLGLVSRRRRRAA